MKAIVILVLILSVLFGIPEADAQVSVVNQEYGRIFIYFGRVKKGDMLYVLRDGNVVAQVEVIETYTHDGAVAEVVPKEDVEKIREGDELSRKGPDIPAVAPPPAASTGRVAGKARPSEKEAKAELKKESELGLADVTVEQTHPSAIFEKVIAKYRSMQTYKAEGTIVSDIETDGMKTNMETSFSIKLKKPNLYLISWVQKNMPMPGMAQSGAVWNGGAQPYLYMGIMNAYSKMASDEVALASATGISGGAAFTIPSLFLSVFKDQPRPFSRLIDPKVEKIEKVEDEECYVISGSSTISKEETFWISKKRQLIIKYSRSLELPEEGRTIPEMTDQQLEEAIRAMGQEVTEERKQEMKNMMKMSRDTMKRVKLKGTSTELHVKITSPKLGKEDFEFKLPEGTILKESLFGGVLGGNE